MRFLVLILFLQQAASSLIQVDSRSWGRTFIVDTTRAEIRRSLRETGAPSPAGPLPAWLPPYPGSVVVRGRGPNDPPDFGYAGYSSTAAPDAVFAHYESALRSSPGITIDYIYRERNRGGSIHAESDTHKVAVSILRGVRQPTDISVNWLPKTIKPVPLAANARLEVVWYDDSRGTLRLRDASTRREYDLDMSDMLSYAKSGPLEAAARADYPAWLVFYPGSKVVMAAGPPAGWRPQAASDMRSYRIEQETSASVSNVGAFYKQAMMRNGLSIENETQSPDWAYSFEARTADRTHVVYLDVLKRGRETSISLMDHYSLPRP